MPGTQADKRTRAPAGGPVYVPADVTEPSLGDSLVAAGFRPGEPTAFTAEGLTMYLTEDRSPVCSVCSSLSPSGRLAANFGVGFEQRDSRHGPVGRRVMAAGGEELRFRLTPTDAPEFMAMAGWSIDEAISGPQLRDRYLGATELATVDVTTSGFALAASVSS